MSERFKANIEDLSVRPDDHAFIDEQVAQMERQKRVFACGQAYEALSYDQQKAMKKAYEDEFGDDRPLIDLIAIHRAKKRTDKAVPRAEAAFMDHITTLQSEGAPLANLSQEDRVDLDDAAGDLEQMRSKQGTMIEEARSFSDDVLNWVETYLATIPETEEDPTQDE